MIRKKVAKILNQMSPDSPDKFGHMFGHAALTSFILTTTGCIVAAIIFPLIIAVTIEIFEARREKKSLLVWFSYLDTAYDLAFDALGILIAIIIYSWLATIIYLAISYFFIRFTNWQDFKKRWWDLNPFHFRW